ncbi:amidohydrolase family protein [Psychrobacillus sp. NEAU-3TGS]|uniref:amidohydrolase family protein n=1 Tax=Psychrobacillus sp. NEAU-3TGS TaxID=2995412 RepID=UPI0024995F6D|nr:amidohydrolase family protein [Psychrobacillus sp. NEAU-3TGS]MDI2587620.1 amidohydrolase family protein [Psychrobacillus sp. NEAU-3TGS]
MTTIYKNCTIVTMDEQNSYYENAEIWVENGKILYVGSDKTPPENAIIEDKNGCIITPGLIDIHTHVGLWSEINEQINDANEYSSPFTPLMNAIDGIDIRHFSFDLAVQGGVTTIQTGAGSANPIGGVWTILKTSGRSLKERIIIERSGLKGALGENPKNVFGNSKEKPMTRMAVAEIIRKGFQEALALSETEKEAVLKNRSNLYPFIEVLEHKMPLHLHCHRADDIATAIRIAKEFDIELSLEHCTEGHLMLDAIKDSKAHVTLGPFMLPPSKYETRNSTPAGPMHFEQAGIPFAIMTDHPFIPIQYLYYCAAEAVKYGLSKTTALRSITIEAAKLTKIDNRVGSLEIGKDADFVIWSHPPFETEANIVETYINGEQVYKRGD